MTQNTIAQGSDAGGHAIRQPSRWRRNLLLLAVLTGGAALTYAWNGLHDRMIVGAAYAARTACSCRYVSGRELNSCEADLDGAPLGRVERMVSLSQDEAEKSVSAGFPLLASQTARFDAKYGCRLEPWED